MGIRARVNRALYEVEVVDSDETVGVPKGTNVCVLGRGPRTERGDVLVLLPQRIADQVDSEEGLARVSRSALTLGTGRKSRC